jgi:hypothetical protein
VTASRQVRMPAAHLSFLSGHLSFLAATCHSLAGFQSAYSGQFAPLIGGKSPQGMTSDFQRMTSRRPTINLLPRVARWHDLLPRLRAGQ